MNTKKPILMPVLRKFRVGVIASVAGDKCAINLLLQI